MTKHHPHINTMKKYKAFNSSPDPSVKGNPSYFFWGKKKGMGKKENWSWIQKFSQKGTNSTSFLGHLSFISLIYMSQSVSSMRADFTAHKKSAVIIRWINADPRWPLNLWSWKQYFSCNDQWPRQERFVKSRCGRPKVATNSLLLLPLRNAT